MTLSNLATMIKLGFRLGAVRQSQSGCEMQREGGAGSQPARKSAGKPASRIGDLGTGAELQTPSQFHRTFILLSWLARPFTRLKTDGTQNVLVQNKCTDLCENMVLFVKHRPGVGASLSQPSRHFLFNPQLCTVLFKKRSARLRESLLCLDVAYKNNYIFCTRFYSFSCFRIILCIMKYILRNRKSSKLSS